MTMEVELARCDSCGENAVLSTMQDTTEGRICSYCYEDYYRSCDHCGEVFPADDVYVYNGEDLCPHCYQQRQEEEHEDNDLYDYNYKPRPVFYPAGSPSREDLFLGVELEVEEDKYNAIPYTATQIIDEVGEWVYCKYDSSLNKGMEVVSHPSILEYHMDGWRPILNILREDFRSHDTITCGLHVHINKNFLSEVERVRLGLFIHNQRTRVEKIARRASNRYTKFKNIKTDCATLRDVVYNADRYEALNWQNEHTIEFRMFRGTLNERTFLATLQFVDSACRFAKTTQTGYFSQINKIWEKYLKFLAGKEEYALLREKLKELGLCA